LSAALLATLLLILTGCLACAYGALIFASIDTSDTATGALVAYGLTFAVPGVAAVAAGIWLLHRRLTRS
jgi:drug/metabolite transporter (DMT)-like permease